MVPSTIFGGKEKKTFSTRTVSNLFKDKSNNFTTRNFVVDKMGPELMEIINKYHPQVLPEILLSHKRIKVL